MYYVKVGDIMETTGERIKRYREAAGLTQEELATKIKTSAQNIYKYEKGIIRNIPLDKIQALSDIFGITPTQLVGWGLDPYAQFKQPAPPIKAIKPVEIKTLSEDEKTLIALYRQKKPSYQKALLRIIEDKPQYEYEPNRESERTINPLSLKLASTMPEYKFREDKKDE